MARPQHLVRRFFGALWPAGPAPADEAWAAAVLNDRELEAWSRMPRQDRRHSIRVARAVEAALAGTEEAGDARWIEAALLHDIGKLESGLGVWGRVVATLAVATAGPARSRAWSDRPGIVGRFGRYVSHPDLGAQRIRDCGGTPEAATWAACHQDPSRHRECRLPPTVVAALAEADDD